MNVAGIAWSPNGQEIAVIGGLSDRDVYLINADGTNLRQLTHLSQVGGTLRWSPVGNRLAFHFVGPATNDVMTVNADGSDLRNLTAGSGRYASYPEWMPDGNSLVFRDLNGNSLWRIGADGSGATRLMVWPAQFVSNLRVSHDGLDLAFTAYGCGETVLASVPASGGAPRTLVCTPFPHSLNPSGENSGGNSPSWCHDDTEILYSQSDGPRPGVSPYGVYAVTRNGATTRYLGTGKSPVALP